MVFVVYHVFIFFIFGEFIVDVFLFDLLTIINFGVNLLFGLYIALLMSSGWLCHGTCSNTFSYMQNICTSKLELY